jgi:hypothetical protein
VGKLVATQFSGASSDQTRGLPDNVFQFLTVTLLCPIRSIFRSGLAMAIVAVGCMEGTHVSLLKFMSFLSQLAI